MALVHCQARSEKNLNFYFNATLTALTLAKWQVYQQHNQRKPFIFLLVSYKRRKLNHHLLEQFTRNLDLDETLIKSHPNCQNLCDYGTLVSQF